MQKIIQKIKSKEMDAVLSIQSCMLKAISDFMYENGVKQLMPVIISPITDPLCHSVFDAKIRYYDQELQLTKSMILHKQIALMGGSRAIYIISPNVRLEKERLKETGKHLIEFSQVDFELKDKKRGDAMEFMERLVVYVFSRVKKECKDELSLLGRELITPARPFKMFESKDLKKSYGSDFETVVSKKMKEPFWISDHEREFYDKEHPERPGYYLNYDLVYLEGFGEALSGGEREYEHNQIIRRMKRAGTPIDSYKKYLHLAKKGLLPRTAGGGFGVERMLRFICGISRIEDVVMFAKVPGKEIYF